MVGNRGGVAILHCTECGEDYENGPCTHVCPGDPVGNLAARVEELEGMCEALMDRVAALENASTSDGK